MKKTLLILFSGIITCASAQIPTTGMIAGYDFNGNANDVSGNGHNGTVTGPTLTTSRVGTPNSAYLFNGTSDYIQVPDAPSLTPTSAITMCAVVRPTGFYSGNCQGNVILMKGPQDDISGLYELAFGDNGYDAGNCSAYDSTHDTFYAGLSTNLTTQGAMSYNSYIQPGSWYCVIGTWDGSTFNMYVNDTLRWSAAASTPLGSNTSPLTFGHNIHIPFPYWFKGVMDDIRIYNRVLTITEIHGYCSVLAGLDEANSFASHVTINTLSANAYQVLLDRNYNKVQVSITSLLGQTVYSSVIENNSGCKLDLSSLAASIYILNVITEEGTYSTKLIRN